MSAEGGAPSEDEGNAAECGCFARRFEPSIRSLIKTLEPKSTSPLKTLEPQTPSPVKVSCIDTTKEAYKVIQFWLQVSCFIYAC